MREPGQCGVRGWILMGGIKVFMDEKSPRYNVFKHCSKGLTSLSSLQ